MHKRSLIILFLLIWMSSAPVPVYADNVGLIMRGVARTVFAVFEIPRSMLQNAGTAFPLGLVGGALIGSVKTVAGTLMGVTDMARGAAPYAKYALLAL